ncbi:MAG: alpha/beta fold hydrolase, partial [Phycisphaerales bacterium]
TTGTIRSPRQPMTSSMEGHSVEIQIVHDGRELRLQGTREEETLKGAVIGRQEIHFILYRIEPITIEAYDTYISYYRPDENVSPVLMERGNTTEFLYIFFDPEEIRIFPLAGDRFYTETGDLIEGQRDQIGQVEGLRWLTPAGRTTLYKRVSLYEEDEIAFRSGDLTLVGSLLRPTNPGPYPAVAFVHGSGSESRERYRRYAAYLARHGIAGFIYDKRGVGDSEGNWILAGFDELAADALSAVKVLQDNPNVISTQVGLWSISQGGWIAPLAAARSKDVAFLIVVSGAGITPGQQEQYLVGNNLSALDAPNRYIGAAHKLIWLKNDLLSLLQRLAPASLRAGLPQMDFYMDLAEILPRIKQPVLLIHGEKDHHLPPLLSTHRFQTALGENLTVCFFAGAVHGIVLEDAAGDGPPVRQFAPGYFETMQRWVMQQASAETAAAPLPGESSFSNDLPLEAANMVRPPLPGRAWVQTLLILYFLLALGSALFVIPLDYLVDGMRATAVAPLALGVAFADLLLFTGTAWLLIRIIGISASGDARALGRGEKPLLVLLLASLVLTVGLVQGVLQQLNNSDFPHIYYVAVTLAAVLFPLFFTYWWWFPTSTHSRL